MQLKNSSDKVRGVPGCGAELGAPSPSRASGVVSPVPGPVSGELEDQEADPGGGGDLLQVHAQVRAARRPDGHGRWLWEGRRCGLGCGGFLGSRQCCGMGWLAPRTAVSCHWPPVCRCALGLSLEPWGDLSASHSGRGSGLSGLAGAGRDRRSRVWTPEADGPLLAAQPVFADRSPWAPDQCPLYTVNCPLSAGPRGEGPGTNWCQVLGPEPALMGRPSCVPRCGQLVREWPTAPPRRWCGRARTAGAWARASGPSWSTPTGR